MTPGSNLTVPLHLHKQLLKHLYPGDGLEAAAILLCARTPDPRTRLLAQAAVLVPHEACKRRERDALSWPGLAIEDAIDRGEPDELSLMLVHSHPGGLFAFSTADDQSDQVTMRSIFQAYGALHGSAIMTPDSAMLARVYREDLVPRLLDSVSVPGHDLRWWWSDQRFRQRPTAFTSETRDELARLSVCVVGVSGTGSMVAEQLARLGFGKVILIDFDHVEHRNLNRILNATSRDARDGVLKVEMFARAIHSYRDEGTAVPLATSIGTREAVLLASQADAIFSCVDTLEARHIADAIASSFLLPLFDVGVVIPTRRSGSSVAIADVCGRMDYVMPGGSTLLDREVYTPATLRAEYLRNVAPDAHRDEVQAGYLRGLVEQAPSVISLNMRAAASCVLEFIARAYSFRHEPNSRYARVAFSVAAVEEEALSEDEFTRKPNPLLARGAKEPLLGLPALATSPRA
jgi:proteasome lid subunit RPN8/RPN11